MDRVNPGEELSAAKWNRFAVGIERFFRYEERGSTDAIPPPNTDSNIIKIRNDSDNDRRMGEILEFTGFVLEDPALPGPPLVWMKGGAVTFANGFGVLLEPLAEPASDDKRIGSCQVSGCCIALVNIADADHKYAVPSTSSYVLQSSIIGPVRIIYKPTGTGEKTCAVQLLGVVGECLIKNASGGDYAAGHGGDTYQLWAGTPGSETYQNCDVTAYNKSSTAFKNGKFGALSYLNGQAYAVPWQT